jgi:hypothetical protein
MMGAASGDRQRDAAINGNHALAASSLFVNRQSSIVNRGA